MSEETQTPDPCAKCEEYLAGWKRALADYDNLKKEMQRDRIILREFAVAQAAEGMLRLCDQMDVAILQLPPDSDGTNPYLKGIHIFRSHCEQELKALGLEPFGEVGDVFDSHVHEAVAQRQDDTKPDQSILDVSQRGWKIGERIIRPARVVVNHLAI